MVKDDWYSKKVPVPMDKPQPKKSKRRRRGKPPTTREKEQKAIEVCRGDVASHQSEYAESIRPAYEVAQVFAEKLGVYYQKRQTNWMKRLKSNKGILGCCSRAACQAEALEVSVQDYVESQFWYFDHVFRRPPRYRDMAGPNANTRYKQWDAQRGEGVPDKTISMATTVLNPMDTPRGIEFEHETKMLGFMVRDWGSEEKVWEMFGDPSNDTFPLWFKQSRKLWLTLFGGWRG